MKSRNIVHGKLNHSLECKNVFDDDEEELNCDEGSSNAGSFHNYKSKSNKSLLILDKGHVKNKESLLSELNNKQIGRTNIFSRKGSENLDESYDNGLTPGSIDFVPIREAKFKSVSDCAPVTMRIQEVGRIGERSSQTFRNVKFQFIRDHIDTRNTSSVILASMTMLKDIYEDGEQSS